VVCHGPLDLTTITFCLTIYFCLYEGCPVETWQKGETVFAANY